MTDEDKNPAAQSRREGPTRAENSATQTLLDKLERSLAKVKPSRRELTLQYFRDLYPRLEAYLAHGKPLKDVLTAFNDATQLKVCARTFNEMLKQQRIGSTSGGETICCQTCGKALAPLTLQGGVTSAATEADTEEVVDA